MDLKFETEASFLNDDKSWLGNGREGINDARSITLDLSLFTAGTHYPNGFIPSGIALGKVTATGLYGPYSNAAGDGRTDFRGFVLSNVEVRPTNTTGKATAALYWRGSVRQSRLPANHGIDANAIVDAGPTSAIADGQAPRIRFDA